MRHLLIQQALALSSITGHRGLRPSCCLVFRLKTHRIVSHAHSLCPASPGVGLGIAPAEFPEGHRGEIVRVGALNRRTKLGEVARGTTTVTLDATGGVSMPKVEQVEDDIVEAPPSLGHRSSGRHVDLHHLPRAEWQVSISRRSCRSAGSYTILSCLSWSISALSLLSGSALSLRSTICSTTMLGTNGTLGDRSTRQWGQLRF